MARPHWKVVASIFGMIIPIWFAGCTGPTGEGSPGEPVFPRVGEEAWYRLDHELDGSQQFTLGYRWGSMETGRDGLGVPVPAIRVDWTLAEGRERAQYDARNAVTVDVATGRLASHGDWDAGQIPRTQQFAASSARWYGYPGLLRNATTGEDTLRAMLFPLFGIATRLAANPQVTSFTDWGVEFEVEHGAQIIVRHPDGAFPQDSLRYAFSFDREGFFPTQVETFLVESTGERRIALLERQDWVPGDGARLQWGSVGSALQSSRLRAEASFAAWSRLPPEGSPSIPLTLSEAEGVARRDVGYSAYLQAHPASYLVRASFHSAPESIDGNAVPTRVASWTLKFADAEGAGYVIIVRRVLTQDGRPIADSTANAASKSFTNVPAPSSLPDKLAPLADMLALGGKEVKLSPADNLFIIYEVSLEPRVAGSEYAVTWAVGLRGQFEVFPRSQATLSALTGATLLRGQFSS